MKKILCVENDHITSYLLKKQIERMGYEMTESVGTGEEAIESCRRISPDLVLMDIKLSGEIDGIEAAEQISMELKIPVIFVTARTDPGIRQRAEQIKPVEYLVKPVEMNLLQKVIHRTLNRVA